MTLQSLIEKMEKDTMHFAHINFGRWVNLATCEEEYYYQAYGFIWGLYGTGYITAEERDTVVEELINKIY